MPPAFRLARRTTARRRARRSASIRTHSRCSVRNPLAGEGFGNGNNAGRTNVVVSDPDDPTIAYLGSDGGGVWKTTNCCTASTSWTIKTDFPEIASMAIGDITIDPSNHQVMYAGTGDLRYGSFSFGAAGVLKSTDKGETWTLLGEDVFNPFYGPSGGGFPQYQAIGKVVVDPHNSSNVIVGTKTGVYFSYDAGTNWTGPCYTNTFSSGAGAQRQDMTGLLAVDQAGSTVLYAAVGTRGLPTPVQPDLVNNGANGVYRTAMPASGCPAVANWTLLSSGFPAGTGNGTPNTTRGRLEIAVAPSDSLTLYAMFANVSTRGVLGVWKTTNGGDTWTQVGTPSGAGTQMWYDAGVTVSPTDPNVLFISTVDLFRSLDGGATYLNLTQAYNGGPVHPDNHARTIVGGDANHVINGNDGGVYYVSNALTATSAFNADWVAMNDTLPTIEIYHGDVTADFATSASPGATAGFQDNGSATVVYAGPPAPADVERDLRRRRHRLAHRAGSAAALVLLEPERRRRGQHQRTRLTRIERVGRMELRCPQLRVPVRDLPLWRARRARQRLHRCAGLHAPDRRIQSRLGNDAAAASTAPAGPRRRRT